ncbi:MAG: hypothetical protein OEU46_18100 [Alphaproteobacteria bacterium]|nr:hypothetical protein [Alphaproteobacteria bacterium]
MEQVMIRNVLFASVVAFGATAVLVSADVSAATADKSSNEFREALYSTCDGISGDDANACMRGRTIVFDQRNAAANGYLQSCLSAGQSRSECDAKQQKYWKDLKEMFGL